MKRVARGIGKRKRPSIGPRYLSPRQIEHEATKLIGQYSAQNPEFKPPFDLYQLIWDYLYEEDEVALDEETSLGDDPETGEPIWGKTLADDRIILIDPAVKRKPFYRFTLAHEIGHWILHCRPILKRRRMIDRIREKQGLDTGPTRSSLGVEAENRREIQANMFAAALLMPEGIVREEYRRRFGREAFVVGEGVSIREIAERIAIQKGENDESSLSAFFDVSRETMAIRLEALGLIKKGE